MRLADVIAEHGEAYRQEYGDRLLPSHHRALQDIVACRTAVMGGHLFECPDCGSHHYHYHSCRNRHCPQCQHQAGEQWLLKQQAVQLPVPYFMLTFTLPASLRALARAEQRLVYNLLFRLSAEATQTLAADERYGGGQLGLLGILHTWGRNLSYHPHVHYLVPALSRQPDGTHRLLRHNFLLPVQALSRIFRAKMRDALRETEFWTAIPPETWTTEWVVHCQSVGKGDTALRYLAPYIFRVALTDRRILGLKNGRVTFSYRQSDTGQSRKMTLPALSFIHRFLQHVLPKGFVKVRYYGFLAPCRRRQLLQLGKWLRLLFGLTPRPILEKQEKKTAWCCLCQVCGGEMISVRTFRPVSRAPPFV